MDTNDDVLENSTEYVELRPDRAALNERLDRFVARQLPAYSRSYIRTLIDEGNIRVDGAERKPSFKLTPGEVISAAIQLSEPEDLIAEDIPLDILHEDIDVIVVNKPAGMVVHPGPGHSTGTLVNALLHHVPDISMLDSNRPGIVHRLDKDTSGVMVVAKHDAARQSLVGQWQRGAVEKHYTAIADGLLAEDEAVIDLPIARHGTDRKRMAVDRDGRNALTIVNVSERFDGATLLDIDLKTGRTHQIRVHLGFIRHPVLGDSVYGTTASMERSRELGIRRQQLHASQLSFALPSGGGAINFSAPLPEDMWTVIAQLHERM